MVMFTFSLFEWKYLFWVNLVQEYKTASLSWNLVHRPIWICRISTAVLFFVLDQKNPFLAIFVQKPKSVCSRWSLIQRPIRIRNGGVHFTCFRLKIPFLGYPFWENLFQKIKLFSLSRKLVQKLIRIWRILWWCLFFLFSTGSILFWKFVS